MFGTNGSGPPGNNWNWKKECDDRKHWRVKLNHRVESEATEEAGASTSSSSNSSLNSLELIPRPNIPSLEESPLEAFNRRFQNHWNREAGTETDNSVNGLPGQSLELLAAATGTSEQPGPSHKLDINHRVEGEATEEAGASARSSSNSSLESAGQLARRNAAEESFLEAFDRRFRSRWNRYREGGSETDDGNGLPGQSLEGLDTGTGSSKQPGPSHRLLIGPPVGATALPVHVSGRSTFGPSSYLHPDSGYAYNFGSHEQHGVPWFPWVNSSAQMTEQLPWVLNDPNPNKPGPAPRTNQQQQLQQQWVPETQAQSRDQEPRANRLQLRPDEYFTYSKQQINLAFQPLTFYIQGRLENGVMYPDEPGYFDVGIYHPSGTSCVVNIQLDAKNRTRFICSFIPTDAGDYRGHVRLVHPVHRHINGSPLKFSVSRQYGGMKAHVIPTSLPSSGFRSFGGRHQRIIKCWGIDVDRFAEKIYLADKETDQVRVLSPQGIKLGEFGGTNEVSKLYRPTGVAVDLTNKRLVVSDKDNHRICFWTLDGQFINAFGSKGHRDGEFYYPWGLAVSPNGALIAVCDSRNHRLQMFDRNGHFLRKYSVFEVNPFEFKDQFEYPRGVCFDNSGERIYVSDFNRHAVYMFNLDLTVKTNFVDTKRVMRPQGLTVDVAGNLLICASKNDCVRVVTSNGTLHSSMYGRGEFTPQDLCILREDKLAVLDAEGVIRIF